MSFRVNDVSKKDCHWIAYKPVRRTKMCNRPDTPGPCPISCGLCCANDPTFTFLTRKVGRKDCQWIESQYDKRRGYCDEKKKIRTACAAACKSCFQPVDDYICEDDVDFQFLTPNGVPKDCKWISRKYDIRNQFCKEKYIHQACPDSCRRWYCR